MNAVTKENDKYRKMLREQNDLRSWRQELVKGERRRESSVAGAIYLLLPYPDILYRTPSRDFWESA